MRKYIFLAGFIAFTTGSTAQMKSPSYFLDKIPNYPASVSEYKQSHKGLETLILEANAEIHNYADALEEFTPEDEGPEKATKRFKLRSAAVSQRNAMQKKNEAEQKKEYLNKRQQYLTDFETLQQEYKNEVRYKIAPLDDKIGKMVQAAPGKSNTDLLRLKKQRENEFEQIMRRYLSGPSAKFRIFLDGFLTYAKSYIIPMVSKEEAAKYESAHLPFVPYGSSIEIIKEYLITQLRAEDNYHDYREWSRSKSTK